MSDTLSPSTEDQRELVKMELVEGVKSELSCMVEVEVDAREDDDEPEEVDGFNDSLDWFSSSSIDTCASRIRPRDTSMSRKRVSTCSESEFGNETRMVLPLRTTLTGNSPKSATLRISAIILRIVAK